jgi:hypothetical protein
MKIILGLLAVLATGSSASAQTQPNDIRDQPSSRRATEAGAPRTDVLPAQRPNDPVAPGSFSPTEAGAPRSDVLPAQRPDPIR